ncbi:MAG: hypothetical protein M1357_02830 [Candidatus Marsarchaeota archaeon]|nr:hypothetical protein [Candidatus Marsarchaeota archaeon]
MTDPLSAKELVDKAYQYVDRVAKECRKNLLIQLTSSKKRFRKEDVGVALGRELEAWFNQRDKLLGVRFNPATVKNGPRGDIHFLLEGKTKDAKFTLNCDAETYEVPGLAGEVALKSVNVTADRNRFTRP